MEEINDSNHSNNNPSLNDLKLIFLNYRNDQEYHRINQNKANRQNPNHDNLKEL